ncbi:arsenate reductase (glutaredoxin) [Sulfuriflexus mobilis]|uniref:arsenate reductase (glutaredoxin) n=1 Tax=Sulfuriflexus mobilis TaxID=1811807 RepID=UPI000F822E7D|nr:arsenate reductase (glutaredoxin) [Sulfuriflexus mobilis]
MSTRIYHNPHCSKCRETLALLNDAHVEAEIVEYLNTPPSREELVEILAMLDMRPRQLMRRHEEEYKANHLDDETLSDDALIDAMLRMPKLIERPIVVSNGKAVIGRPPVNVKSIL